MILMNDFISEPAELKEAMLVAVRRVLDSGYYILSKEFLSFENQWASLCGVDHAIGVANGMDAIEIALRALDIGEGDEVITTPITAFATVLAILRAGAIPVLADIDCDTALLSPESVSRCLTKKTKGIVLVHLYGQLRDLSYWLEFCNQNNIKLIEDCSQSHLATIDGKVAGSFGEAGAYSFYPTKNLGAIGDGGALITNSSALAERAAKLRNYGQSIRYNHPELGMNSRLDEIQAAILSERIRWLKIFTDRRREIANYYRHNIQNNYVELLAPPQEDSAHVNHLFVIKINKRDDLQKYLYEHNIQSLIHYPVPVHFQESCKNMKKDPRGLAVSEQYVSQCLSIPCHPQMSNIDLEQVINVINNFR